MVEFSDSASQMIRDVVSGTLRDARIGAIRFERGETASIFIENTDDEGLFIRVSAVRSIVDSDEAPDGLLDVFSEKQAEEISDKINESLSDDEYDEVSLTQDVENSTKLELFYDIG